MGCGVGSLARQNSMLCQASLTASRVSLRRLTARSWSARVEGSNDLSMEKSKLIRCQVHYRGPIREGSYEIAMAACGSEQQHRALRIYTKGELTCLRNGTASPAMMLWLSLKIAKAIFGLVRRTASTVFATLRSPRF